VLAGPDGIFMVDAQYAQVGDKVLAAVRRIDPGPIRFLVNTHNPRGPLRRQRDVREARCRGAGARGSARTDGAQLASAPPGLASDPARLPVLTYGMGEPVIVADERRNRRVDSGSRRPLPAATRLSGS
jgi:hypothetical protein